MVCPFGESVIIRGVIESASCANVARGLRW